MALLITIFAAYKLRNCFEWVASTRKYDLSRLNELPIHIRDFPSADLSYIGVRVKAKILNQSRVRDKCRMPYEDMIIRLTPRDIQSFAARKVDRWTRGSVTPIVPGDASDYVRRPTHCGFTRLAIKAQQRNPMQRRRRHTRGNAPRSIAFLILLNYYVYREIDTSSKQLATESSLFTSISVIYFLFLFVYPM